MEEISGLAARLPEELLDEILARVPYRSLCRFRCVSPSWRTLCSDLGLIRRSPQTLSGFFCYARRLQLLNYPGRSGRPPLLDPSLPFLCGHYEPRFTLVDCCGGLLLCECFAWHTPFDRDYVVCNPATEEWTVLPGTEKLRPENLVRLGFDPADPSRFTVFVLVQAVGNGGTLRGLEIYSSQTGAWTSKQIGWHQRTRLDTSQELASVFMNGALHLPALYFPTLDDLSANITSIITVDMDGETWREFISPHFRRGHHRIGQSRGRLHAMEMLERFGHDGCTMLVIWVLEDYASGREWTLKHDANISRLLGVSGKDGFYMLIGIHPEIDLVFFIDGVEERLMSYDMDTQEVHVVYNKGECYLQPYHPYTPCFAELPSK